MMCTSVWTVEGGDSYCGMVRFKVTPAVEGGVIGADVQKTVLGLADAYLLKVQQGNPMPPIKGIDAEGDPVKVSTRQYYRCKAVAAKKVKK